MPDTIASVSMLFLMLFVWVEGGRAHWTLIVGADAQTDDDTLALLLALGAGDWKARFFWSCFVAVWPAWIALGFTLALIARLRASSPLS